MSLGEHSLHDLPIVLLSVAGERKERQRSVAVRRNADRSAIDEHRPMRGVELMMRYEAITAMRQTAMMRSDRITGTAFVDEIETYIDVVSDHSRNVAS